MAKKKPSTRAQDAPPDRPPLSFAIVVRQSRRSRHDRALFRALSQLRTDPRRDHGRPPDHRHRADRLRPLALQPPPPAARRAGARQASATPAASRWNSPAIRSRRPASGRPPRSIATSSYLSLVEVLFGYPLDGVVLTTGCDKTTPAAIMAAATVNIPAIVLSGGPMLDGWWKGKRAGSGTIKWEMSKRLAAGEIDYARIHRRGGVVGAVDRPLQYHGHGLDHERAGGGARPVAAGLRRDPGALRRARADRLRDRQARRRDRPGRTSSPPTSSPARRSRTPSSPARRSAARPTRPSTSMRLHATSACRCRSRIGRRSATTCRSSST